MKTILIVGLALMALAGAGAAQSADVPQLAAGGEFTDQQMTDAEAGRYMQEMGIGRAKCGTATDHRYLYVAASGHHVADVYNHTSRCWFRGHLVQGSVRVLASQTHDTTFSTENRLVTVGYPAGYGETRRNTCVKMTVKWELTQLNTWDLAARLQVRGDGTAFHDTTCYANMGTRSW